MMASFLLGSWLVIAGAHPYLNQGQRLYEDQSFELALTKLTMAAGVAELSVDDRRLTFDLLARCHVALGRMDRAEEAFAQLLSVDPSSPTPQAAPKLREAFLRVKQRLYSADHVKLTALAAPANQIWIELVDPWALTQQVVLFQAGAEGKFTDSPLRASEGQYGGALSPGSQRYFVQALGSRGATLASLGDEAAPLRITAALTKQAVADPSPVASAAPRRSRLPVWLVGGVSAAALLAGGALAIASGADSGQAGASAFASDRKKLDDSSRDKAIAANVLVGVCVAGGAGTVVLAWAL